MNEYLKFDDIDNRNTETYQVIHRLAQERQAHLEKAARLREFDLYLSNWLMRNESMTYSEYNLLMNWYGHTEYTIPEIFQKVFKERA